MGRGPGGPPGGSGGGSGPTPGNRHFGGFWAPTEYQILWKRGVLGGPPGGLSRGGIPRPGPKIPKKPKFHSVPTGRVIKYPRKCTPPGPGGPPGVPPGGPPGPASPLGV